MILGLDLGVKSVGIALIDASAKKIALTAARVFPAGVEGDFEAGRDSSRNQNRREKRLQRRQTDRRARRLKKVYNILANAGLFPEGDPHEQLKELDRRLAKKYGPHPGHPYVLRAKALDQALEPFELGRALYHLSQRRGFLSNRLAPVKEDEETGTVKGAIESLEQKIAAAGKRTLGEYLAGIDPRVERIRERYTSRRMYEQEFVAIWTAQAPHHASLTLEWERKLYEAIFHQRPLKDQDHLIGRCSLIPTEPRAPLRLLEAQRFRILDRVNNLRLAEPDRPLAAEERAKLAEELERSEKLTYAQVRKLLGIKAKFSIEAGGEKAMPGNTTYARFAQALNWHWTKMPRERQDRLVEEWHNAKTDEAFAAALRAWNEFSEDEIARLCQVRLQDGYLGFSLAAIRRLMPHLEKGLATSAARKAEFPETFESQEPLPLLPPVAEALPELRNPAVMRVLTEVRKCVNAVIKKYGKPEIVRIELARDLKRNKKDRQALTDQMREREKEREAAKMALKKCGLEKISRADVEKYLLWEECGGICPYTGKCIDLCGLFGHQPQFDVEHIVPRSRSLDDSFLNKTLCHRDENLRKRRMTPWEMFRDDPAAWERFRERVSKFKSKAKRDRLLIQETDTEKLLATFSSNQLNDTRYASRLAAKYVGLLYGGVDDASGTKRVYTSAGQITAQLRRFWNCESILDPNKRPYEEKKREDHRHHAIDAAVTAMASPAIVQELSRAAAQSEQAGQRRLRSFVEPWPGFRDQLHTMILEHTVVSHRPERKLQGPLHEETYYAVRQDGLHIRKPLESVDPNKIVDKTVRERVLAGHQTLADGTPIKRVRVHYSGSPVPISEGRKLRHVLTGDNHHMEVVAVQKRGKTSYVGFVVSRLEAMRRRRMGEPVVKKDHGPDTAFLFSLSEGDMVRWKGELWRVRGVTLQGNGLLTLSRAQDARLKADIPKEDLPRPTVNVFVQSGGRKVNVSPLGEVRDAHD
jgi:CRISPR-associated endonuclease Csn1